MNCNDAFQASKRSLFVSYLTVVCQRMPNSTIMRSTTYTFLTVMFFFSSTLPIPLILQHAISFITHSTRAEVAVCGDNEATTCWSSRF